MARLHHGQVAGIFIRRVPIVPVVFLSFALAACGTTPGSAPKPGSLPSRDAASPAVASPRQQARPAATFLPSGIHAVVVSAVPGGNDKKRPPAPVTVTDPSRVRQLVSLVNGLPLFPPGTFNCPFDDGRGVRLAFLAAVGGPVLGTALAKSNGCGGVMLVIGAGRPSMDHAVRNQIALGFGAGPAEKALAASGMRWKLSGYLPG